MHHHTPHAGLAALLIAMLAITGCATAKVNVGFPDVPLRKPASGAPKIGVARVEDTRGDPVLGSTGNGLQSFDLLAGPNLLDYINRRFRNDLAGRGFDPVTALDPTRTSLPQPYKTLVVTLQSARFSFPVFFWGLADSSINIAVQVYAPPRNLIFSGSYSGAHGDRPALATSAVVSSIMADSADEAVKAAFADPNFENAIR